MLFPFTHVWTRRQKGLIVGSVVSALALAAALIYGYERYHRGPDDSFYVGIWRGTIDYNVATIHANFRFKPNHIYHIVEGESEPSGKWYGGGEFLYLRQRLDDASGPYDRLQIWHIDSMTWSDLRMHDLDGLHAVLRRAE